MCGLVEGGELETDRRCPGRTPEPLRSGHHSISGYMLMLIRFTLRPLCDHDEILLFMQSRLIMGGGKRTRTKKTAACDEVFGFLPSVFLPSHWKRREQIVCVCAPEFVSTHYAYGEYILRRWYGVSVEIIVV